MYVSQSRILVNARTGATEFLLNWKLFVVKPCFHFQLLSFRALHKLEEKLKARKAKGQGLLTCPRKTVL